MSQKSDILAHLLKGEEISRLPALHLFGCMELSARICELQHDGYEINTKFRNITKSNGKVKSVAVYTLSEGALKVFTGSTTPVEVTGGVTKKPVKGELFSKGGSNEWVERSFH